MKKKALVKNFYRTVYRSITKFFSILFLISLGVMVFVGLKITTPIMQNSVEKRIKEGNLYDFKISSSFSLLKKDIDIIKNLDNVKDVEFGYSIDLQDAKREKFHIENLPQKVSTVKVVEGEKISKDSDILLDERLKDRYKINEKIHFDEISKTGIFKDEVKKLKLDTFYVKGFIKSPEVLSTTLRGTTENGYLAIVSKDVFDFTNYSFAKITFSDMENLKKQSKKFEKMNNDRKIEIQEKFSNRPIEVYNLVYSEKKSMLDEKKKELSENKNLVENNEKELSENQKKLESGKRDLRSSHANINYKKNLFLEKINNKKEELSSLKNDIDSKKELLFEKINDLVDKNKSLVSKKEKIVAGKNILSKSLFPLKQDLRLLEENYKNNFLSKQEYDQKKEILSEKISKLEQKDLQLDKSLGEVEDGLKKISSILKEVYNNKKLLEEKETELNNGFDKVDREYKKGLATFEAYYEKLNQTQEKLKSGELKVDSGKKEIEDAKEKISNADEKISDADEILSKLIDPIYSIEDGFSTSSASVVYFAADGIWAVSNIFSSFFYFIALLVCLTTMTRTVDEDRIQIGTLKALGYSNIDIAKHYFYYGFFASLIGGIIGCILGFKIISPLVYRAYLKSFIFSKVSDSLHPLIVFSGIFIAILCTSFVSYFACIGSLKENISSLMRAKAPKSGNKVLLEKIPFIWKELSFLQKVTMRNIFRYKLRLSMTIIGVMGCMGLLVLGFGIKDSLDGISQLQYEKYTKYHLSVVYNPLDLEKNINKLKEDIKNNKDIKDSMTVSMDSADIKSDIKFNEKIGVFSVDNLDEFSKFFGLYEKKKKIESLDDGLYINTKLSEKFHKKVGDVLTFIVNNKEYSYKIRGIFENHVGNFIIMNEQTHEKIFSKKPIKNTELLILKSIQKDFVSKVRNDIEKNDSVLKVMDIEVFKKLVDEASTSIDSIILVIVICSGFLSIVVLYNLSNINISERKREIATLKVLGFYPKEIDNYIYKETFILTIIGIIFGIFVGKKLHINIMQDLAVDGLRFFNIIKLKSYVYSALITLFFTVVVYFIVKIILSKIKMIESLKDVE